jgi:hypothetical protein
VETEVRGKRKDSDENLRIFNLSLNAVIHITAGRSLHLNNIKLLVAIFINICIMLINVNENVYRYRYYLLYHRIL